jgi:hypothetical protein
MKTGRDEVAIASNKCIPLERRAAPCRAASIDYAWGHSQAAGNECARTANLIF